jgi:murein L,D-transpeptidase YcbB/YkuD
MKKRDFLALTACCAVALAAPLGPALAQDAPENILPAAIATPARPARAPATPALAPSPVATPSAVPADAATPPPVATAQVDEPVMHWTLQDAEALLTTIEGIGSEGLFARDYQPDALRTAILGGEGEALDAQASRSFAWLAEDLRDGRTRMPDRLGWFIVDTDVDTEPVHMLMAEALVSHDIAGTLLALDPTNPDFAALRSKLSETPESDKPTRALIRINMDRWRWLPRDLGPLHLLTNIPEFQLRVVKNDEVVLTYRTVVGKPGRTATPQLAEQISAVVFNPTWTVPQSIVVGEGLGADLLAHPAKAAREGYKVYKQADGTVIVVQQPGKNNSLGLLKLDMPNEHAIFVHDTPNRNLFNLKVRALSHGCVRTERAQELGMTMAILGAGMTPEQGVEFANSGKYTRVPMTRTFPIYLTYFTMATDVNGEMRAFDDLYDRDPTVLAAFANPRQPWTGQRKTTEQVIKLDNPL